MAFHIPKIQQILKRFTLSLGHFIKYEPLISEEWCPRFWQDFSYYIHCNIVECSNMNIEEFYLYYYINICLLIMLHMCRPSLI